MEKPKTVKLTLAGVKRACREAMDKKILLFQASDSNSRYCKYKSGKYRCAIGAALPEEVLDFVENESSYLGADGTMNTLGLNELVHRGLIFVQSGNILAKLNEIQSTHDSLMHTDMRTTEGKKELAKFRKLIGA